MLLQSKILPVTRLLLRREAVKLKPVQPVRNGGSHRPFYRNVPSEQPRSLRYDFIWTVATGFQIFFWWYVFTRMYYSWDHHFIAKPHLKDPRLYSDAELGIPPDEEDGEAFPGQDLSIAPLWKRVPKPAIAAE